MKGDGPVTLPQSLAAALAAADEAYLIGLSNKGTVNRAKKDLESFQKELKDVPVSLDLRMEIGSFLSFADFFFDDPVSDYLIYSRIQNTREDVEDGIQLVEELLEKLRKQW